MPDFASRQPLHRRRRLARAGIGALAGGLGLLWVAAAAPAAAAGPTAGTVQTDATQGYARLVFQFQQIPDIKTRVANNILIIQFGDRIDVPVDRVVPALSAYVAGARVDPDGRAIRIALAQRVTVNTMQAAGRLFVDLLPSDWKGAPPPLPQDVIDELNAKAREADRLAKEAAARQALAKPKPIAVKAVRLPTFTRLSFLLGDAVPVRLARNGTSVVLTFDAALHVELAALKARLPTRLTGIDAEEKDSRLTVTLRVADGADVRAFWDGGDYLVDLTGVETDAGESGLPAGLQALVANAPDDGLTALPSELPPAAPAAAPAKAGPQTVPAQAAPAPAGDHAEAAPPARPKVAAPVVPPPAAPASVPSRGPAAAPDNSAAASAAPPAVPAGPTPPPAAPAAVAPAATVSATALLRPDVTVTGQTVRIAFPFDRTTPSAIYRRGDSLWMVFDTERTIDAGAVAAAARDVVASAEVAQGEGGAILHLRLKTKPLITASPDGFAWIVSIGNDILGAASPVVLRRASGKDGRAVMSVTMDGIGRVRRIRDTDMGDTVFAVTAAAPARGFLKSQSFVEFRTLVTAQGLALVPNSDDVTVSATLDTATVSRDGGLTVSSDGVAAPVTAPVAAAKGSILDASDWMQELERPFRQRERDLIRAAAGATDAERLNARIALARFYLAKGFAVEAGAVLDVAGAGEKATSRVPEFALLRAAAFAMQGRGEEAISLLADNGLIASPEGALWHAMAEAAGGHVGATRDAFQKGEAALPLYPPALQARFRMIALKAALDANDVLDAAAQKAALDALGVTPAEPAQLDLLQARLADAQDRKGEALETFRRIAEGPDGAVAAEARLRGITLRHTLKQLDDKGYVDELENLAATWRGDEIEAETLRALAEQHLKSGRDREAFDTMKVALEHFPKSDATRSMQDKMQARFMSLFLDDEANRLSPIEALALFYDYQGLTPADARGDEMIRKLADRLVGVDLLDQAAELLQHQIEHRLVGAGRAQVAARLAMIDLMNRKPSQALAVLDDTRMADLPRPLVTARLILEARALAETARPDLAVEILDQVDDPLVPRARADILWQARHWPEAGAAIETLLGDCWQGDAPLTDAQRADAMRAAIAFSLADDAIGLDRLRSKFAAKMANSADASSFEAVTAPIEARGTKFSDIAREIAGLDTLDAFLKAYQARGMPGAGTPDAAKPAAPPTATPGQPSAAAEGTGRSAG